MNLLQQNKEILLCVLSSTTARIFARIGTALAPSQCGDDEFITTLFLEHCREPSIAVAARFYRSTLHNTHAAEARACKDYRL